MKEYQFQEYFFEKKSIRIVFIDGEPWWIATDICNVLQLSEVSNSLLKLSADEKLIRKVFVSGQDRDAWFVNESGLYRLIFRSTKPFAERFRRWVFSEVLPAIRRTGQYSLPSLPHGVILQDSGFEYIPPLSERISSLESSVSDIKEAINSITFTGCKIENLHREYQNKPHSKKYGNCRVKCSFQDVYRVEWLTGMWLSVLGASITEKEVVTLAIDSLIEKLKLELKGEKPSFALQRTTIPVNPLRIPYDR